MNAPLDLRDKTILLVDDAPVSLAMTENMLRSKGLRLAIAQSGREALEYVAFNPPDLILLDVLLPDINGFEVCRRLKRGEYATIPIMFMTSLSQTADKLCGFQAGAVDYVTKPLQAEEVLARINTHLMLAHVQAQLKSQNAMLAAENFERQQAQLELLRYRDSLECQVSQRTAEVRQLATHQESVREEERKHIARELHDELGQALSALRLQTGMLRVRFGASTPELNDALSQITGLIDRTINTVRNVSSSLRPPMLDLGLGPALEWLAAEFRQHNPSACQLTLAIDEVVLSEALANTVFRIVQESLTNIRRHAQASHASITLQASASQCCLEIRDDGCGFEVAHSRPHSYGLLGIRERVLSQQGQLTISSQLGGPSRIIVYLPLNAT